MHLFDALEGRRLFAGGIDPSFGSSRGTEFQSAGASPTTQILDTAVDPNGRIILAGYSSADANDAGSTVILARLNADGVPDPTFGTNGVVTGLPRALRGITQVLALPGGGYLATGGIGGGQAMLPTATRLVKFDNRGRVDARFGHNGFITLGSFVASQILQQPDGKYVIVGTDAALSDDVFDPTKRVNYAIRLDALGHFDQTFGTEGRVSLGTSALEFGRKFTKNDITSASLDASGRLLLVIKNEEAQYDANNTLISISTSTFLRRLGGKGQVDPKFVSKRFSLDTNDAIDSDFTVYSTVSITRPDGQVVLLQTNGDPSVPVTAVDLIGANGQLVTSSGARGGFTGSFYVPNAADGSVFATQDNGLIIVGSAIDGSARVPAMIRLNSNLQLDFTFGTNGVLRLPSGDSNVATQATFNPDGTINVLNTQAANGTRGSGELNALRVFADDKPVVSLRDSRSKDRVGRVTVSIRGVNPINVASLDAYDLRLSEFVGSGRRRLRLLDVVQDGDGDLLATYQTARTGGVFSLNAIAGQVEDTSHHTNDGGVIGTIVI